MKRFLAIFLGCVLLILIGSFVYSTQMEQDNPFIEVTKRLRIPRADGLKRLTLSNELKPMPILHPVKLQNVRNSIPAEIANKAAETVLPPAKTWHMVRPDPYKAGEMVIQFKGEVREQINIGEKDQTVTMGIESIDKLNKQYGAEYARQVMKFTGARKQFDLDLIYVIAFPSHLDMEEISSEYRKDASVKTVSPNYRKQLHDVPWTDPNDPNYDWAPANTKNPQMWGSSFYGSATVNIAELEDAKYDHPDLNLNWSGDGYDFENGDPDPYGIAGDAHGTRCIGTAVAETHNLSEVAGTVGGWFGLPGMSFSAWQCAYLDQCIQAIDSAAEYGADVENISWGFGNNPAGLEDACNYAVGLGTVICASAGNDNSPEPGWPAYYANVIAVGGNSPGDRHWAWNDSSGSNYGPWVDIVAPGDAQYTLNGTNSSDNNYGGTSFSSPRAAAVCAAVKHAHPAWTAAQIREAVERTADYTDYLNPRYEGSMGSGRVNAYEARNVYDVNVSVNQIIAPTSSLDPFQSVYPKALIQNRGIDPATFNVTCSVDSSGTIVYTDTKSITDLDHSTRYGQHGEVVTFAAWTPYTEDHTYTMKVYTSLGGDLNTVNDTVTVTITISALAGLDTLIIDTGDYTGNGANGSAGWKEAVRLSTAGACSVMALLYHPYNPDTMINWRIWDDDGAGGFPGTLLDSGSQRPNVGGTWYQIDITPLYVPGGDIYVGWEDVATPYYYNGYDGALDNYNYFYDGTQWIVDYYFGGDFMIRAIVKYPGQPDHDVLPQYIGGLGSKVIPQNLYFPTATIRNQGKNSEGSFDVECRIDSSGTNIYSDTETVSSILPGMTSEVNFDTWIPDWEGGTYNMKIISKLAGDNAPGNDTLAKDINCSSTDTLFFDEWASIYYTDDNSYWAVRFTPSGPCSLKSIRYYCYVQFLGGGSAERCTLLVFDDNYDEPGNLIGGPFTQQHQEVSPAEGRWHTYLLLFPVNISNGEDFWLCVWTPGNYGNNKLCYMMSDGGENNQDRSDFSLDRTSWYRMDANLCIRAVVKYYGTLNTNDVGIESVDNPPTLLHTDYAYTPQTTVKNYGTASQTFDVICRFDTGGVNVYSDTATVTALAAGLSQQVNFTDWQAWGQGVYYDQLVYTLLGGDENTGNDTFAVDSLYATPDDIIWYEGVGEYYWGDDGYKYGAVRFTPEQDGWLIASWVALQDTTHAWANCSLFVWDDDDGLGNGGLPDSLHFKEEFAPPGGPSDAYWFYLQFGQPLWFSNTDFFIGVWAPQCPNLLLDGGTTVWRSFISYDRGMGGDPNGLDWGAIDGDLLIEAVMRYPYGNKPLPPYIYAAKSGTDDSLYWSAVTQDTAGDDITVEAYRVFSGTTPDFVPGASFLGETGSLYYTDPIAPDYYYLVCSRTPYMKLSNRSNMGYQFRKTLNEEATKTDKNWVSLPFNGEYANASDITDEFSPSGTPIYKITKRNPDQTYVSRVWIGPPINWSGNFPISKGEMYEISVDGDTAVILVGSHDPNFGVPLNENPAMTDKNWVSIPYNAVYAMASDITDEFSPSGTPIYKITKRNSDQTYTSRVWIGPPINWSGDFAITRGEGLEISVDGDTVWTPTVYTNTAKDKLAKRESKEKLLVSEDRKCMRLVSPAWGGAHSKVNHISKVTGNRIKGSSEGGGESHTLYGRVRSPAPASVTFITFLKDRPEKAMDESFAGSSVETRENVAYWVADIGNLPFSWKSGDEVITILGVEESGGTVSHEGYYRVLKTELDGAIDPQECTVATMVSLPRPVAVLDGGEVKVRWESIDDEYVIGYSLYRSEDGIRFEERLNSGVITDTEYTDEDVEYGKVYYYALRLVYIGGYESPYLSGNSQVVEYRYGEYWEGISTVPKVFDLGRNMPNPFSSRTEIRYQLPERVQVNVVIYDVMGRQIRRLVSAVQDAGFYSITWDGMDSSGEHVGTNVYFYRLTTSEGFIATRKMNLVR